MSKKKYPPAVALSEQVHKKLKLRAVKAGVSIKSMVNTALVMYLTATNK